MEDTTHFQDVEDSEDALSFCGIGMGDSPVVIPIHNFQSHNDHPNPSCPDDDFFEFLPDPTADLVGWRSESLTPTAAAASRSRHMSGSYLSMKMTSPARSKKHACLFGSSIVNSTPLLSTKTIVRWLMEVGETRKWALEDLLEWAVFENVSTQKFFVKVFSHEMFLENHV
ncbi:hypothetical protein AAG906_034438 [Vitis piasezkii]